MPTTEYQLAAMVPIPAFHDTLHLAVLATATLHSDEAVRRQAPFTWSPTPRRLILTTGSPVAKDLERLVVGMTQRAYGTDAIHVVPRREIVTDEYRTFGDWVDELGLNPDEAKTILKFHGDVHLDTPLTSEQVNDLLGLTIAAYFYQD